MNKAILALKSVLVFVVLLFQAMSSYALLDPAEREAQEAKKRKLVEATDHTISGSALQDYVDERERREDERRDAPKKGERWGGDPDDDLEEIHHEDEEFFEEKEEAYDEAPGSEGLGEDFNPNEKA